MIRSLTGTVNNMGDHTAVIEVSGLGYLVHTNVRLLVDQEVTLHTHLAVRETALDLYGFQTTEELSIFELLLTLPKIGPKSALQIMIAADTSLLCEAVQNQDSGYLSKMSGIGKKTAEKIVTGLKDKLENLEVGTTSSSAPTQSNHSSDTIDALIALGYSPNDAREAVVIISKSNPELMTPNEILKAALRQLS